ncbi:MAG: cytochrome C [Acidobacteria bacterium]|nr:cytochrome C [Acidobacteriota bacterium]
MVDRVRSRHNTIRRLFNYANNPITITGFIVTTVSALTIIIFMIAELSGGFSNPYVGIFAYLILPALFVLGLIIMPIGMWRRRKKLLATGASLEELAVYPRLDFNDPHLRKIGMTVLLLTAVNAIILGSTSYLAVDEMDTVSFCGTTCHTVMQPEYTAYQQSPHSRVRCVQCHIGPGASWFVRSKLDGLRQVWKTAWGTYHRPIETPIHNLRPARETCEQCHWPMKHHGDKLKVFATFDTDEHNTASYTAMLIKTGGGSLDLGRHGGIHWWHIYSDNKIMYYAADKHRQKIVWVELTTPDGQVRTYTRKSDKLPPIAEIKAKARVMDCIDCHNRPTHLFKKPDHALDDVLAAHPDMQQLPFFKKIALDAINKGYKTHEGGMTAVQRAVLTYYQQKYPAVWSASEKLVRRAADAASRVYGRSYFPAMKTDWKTHPDNLGHRDFPGCWRCHDDEMSTADGKHTIPQDCDTCHIFLEEDSPKPPVFQDLMAQQ